jgi:6-phosphogluconolactonase
MTPSNSAARSSRSRFASGIDITPNGKFLYGAVRTTSMLHGCKIDPEKATLTGIGKLADREVPARLQH